MKKIKREKMRGVESSKEKEDRKMTETDRQEGDMIVSGEREGKRHR